MLELLFRPSELCEGMPSGPKLHQNPLIRPQHGNPQSLPHLSALRSPKHQSETQSQMLLLFDKVNTAVSARYRRMLFISGERERQKRDMQEKARRWLDVWGEIWYHSLPKGSLPQNCLSLSWWAWDCQRNRLMSLPPPTALTCVRVAGGMEREEDYSSPLYSLMSAL